MPLLRLTEHYTSVQGEGPRVGQVTQFVRFGGCNMRCPGWPCDTPHAIYPKHWKNDPLVHPDDLMTAIKDKALSENAYNICLTGGEPFLQDHDYLHQVVAQASQFGCTIDIFSNGSFHYPGWVFEHPMTYIIMDWKLRGSGEADTALDERMANARQLRVQDWIKFVVTGQNDLEEAQLVSARLARNGYRGSFSVGAAWGKITDDEIVEFMKNAHISYSWVLNVQVHKHIWGEQRGV